MNRNRLGALLIGALALSILALLPIAKWHSSPSCDARTHIEMIRGVTEHGLPYGTNNVIGRFPELRARWNIVVGDRLWGTYPPVFAYVAAPFFRLGGLAAVSRLSIVLLAMMALAVFALANRFLHDRLWAAVAATLAISSTPIPSTSLDMSPYILAESLVVLAMLFALTSVERASRSAYFLAGLGGICGGLAVGAHLLTFPMFVGVLLALAAANLDSWIPKRASLLRALCMLTGFLIALAPVAALNHLRFHSYNPISYGPCPWRSCAETGQDQQHLGDILEYALPTLAWAGALLAGLFFVRKKPLHFVTVILVALIPLAASSILRKHAWQIAMIGWGNVFDVSYIDIQPINPMPDGIGRLFGPWLVRSALQCTPLLLLAFFVPWKNRSNRNRALLLGLPAFFLYVACALRANEPPVFAFGFPFAYLRYTVPAAAPLTILAVAAVRDLPWRPSHVAFVVLASAAIAIFLTHAPNYDAPLWRRVFLLYGTLLSALVAALALWRSQRSGKNRQFTAFAVALAMTLGIGPNLGETFPAMKNLRDENDLRLDDVAKIVPQRFALVGFSAELDTPLALRATRDIEYIDLYETDASKGWATFRAMIDVWTDDGRPIFALWPVGTDPPSPWTDVAFERILPRENLYRIRKL